MKARRGFTFLEVMVVLLILGLITALVTPAVIGMLEESRKKVAKIQMDELHAALKWFKAEQGRYPTAAEGLGALTRAPASAPRPDAYPASGYLSAAVPDDPWGRAYGYFVPGRGGAAYELVSRGADPDRADDDVVSPCPELPPAR